MRRSHQLLLFLLVTLVFNSLVFAMSYEIVDLRMKMEIDEDGLVHVVEERTVEFNGSYSGFFQYIDTGRGDFAVRDLSVAEKGKSYVRLKQSSPGPVGTYYVLEKDKEVYVDWSFSAKDESRTFILSYILDGVVFKHGDVAELYYKFVGDQWKKPHGNVRVSVSLPLGATADEIRAWGHGPAHGEVRILSGREVEWEISPLPAETMLEGRVTFPTDLVWGTVRQTNKEALPGIIAEETRWAQRINRARRYRQIDPLAGLAVLVSSVFIVFSFWRKRSVAQSIKFKEKYFKELPAAYPPAELAILYRRFVTSADLTATILDLARRGFLSIEEIPGPGSAFKARESYRFVQKEGGKADLLTYEKQVLDLLFEKIGEGQVTLEEIQDYAKTERKSFAKFWSKWCEEVTEETKKHKFFDEEARKQSNWMYVPTLLGLLLSIPFLVIDMIFLGFGFLLAAFIFFAGALLGNRRSVQGSLEFTKWQAFRRYLQHFSRVEDSRVTSLGIWEKYIPYAITLGVGKRALKQLEIVFSHGQEQAVFAGHWFIYRRQGGLTSLSQMTDTISRSISSATGQVSRGGGAGGGFSGGGGGGFGGGGGGAR